MDGGLLQRLGDGVTFVVGKGGVGKTTLAGGLALALADAGRPTHLLSVDPAHSLGDLFGTGPLHGPRPSPCTTDLVLEELDGDRLARAELERLSPGLLDLIDRGTYLSREDAATLLDAAVPGLDEVGAVLRIARLAPSPARLVVDTPPTGHALRLLETPATVRGWLDVFDAMAAKADAVASALTRRDVRMPVEAELEGLADTLDAFEGLASRADFVVVTGAGRAVSAETRRLIRTLRHRGFRVAATVSHDPENDVDVRVERRPGVGGCDGLRAWWSGRADRSGAPDRAGEAGTASGAPTASASGGATGSVARSAGAAAGSSRAGASADRLAGLLDRDLVVFAGKGGVGKTTCAAAAAVRLAEVGAVTLLGADPAGSLADVLPDPPAGIERVELDAARELDRLKEAYVTEVERLFEALGLERAARLDREVVASLWRLAPPGLDEVMAVTRLATGESAGRVLLDTAPTGHFLRLAAMPDIALAWVRRILRILLRYGVGPELDGAAEPLLRLAKRFRALGERITDSGRTAIVVVTLDEPMARSETRRLMERARALRLPVAGLVVNRATGPVAPVPGVATWRAPDVPEPVGAQRLASFLDAWELVT